MENPGYKGQATYILPGLPGQGRPAELTDGGMPGPSGDKDCNAGTLPAQSCPVHRGHYGGGKPHPPTVHPMQHAGTPVGTELQAPCHSSVHLVSGAEEVLAGGGGAEGDIKEGI